MVAQSGWMTMSSIPRRGNVGIFLFTIMFRPPTQRLTHTSFYWVLGALLLEIEQAEHEANHISPSDAEVKNVWRCTSTLPVCLHGVVFGHRGNFTLLICHTKCCRVVICTPALHLVTAYLHAWHFPLLKFLKHFMYTHIIYCDMFSLPTITDLQKHMFPPAANKYLCTSWTLEIV